MATSSSTIRVTNVVPEYDVRIIAPSQDESIGESTTFTQVRQELQDMLKNCRPTKIFVITDDVVSNLHEVGIRHLLEACDKITTPTLNGSEAQPIANARDLQLELRPFADTEVSSRTRLIILPHGESTKTRCMKALLEDKLLIHHADRNSLLVAVGGGVLGDLVGFVAATYYRGIRHCFVATTLLSMVDSATGGKTAVDVEGVGKNLIGCFKQPFAVWSDLSALKTLPAREMANGMAEVVKIALTSDAELFKICENRPGDWMRNFDFLTTVVSRAVRAKVAVVQQDERDAGIRNILNFGHTVGHAIEMAGRLHLLHGEAVAIGCVYELMAARRLGYCSPELVQRAELTFQAFGLPTKVPGELDIASVLGVMDRDKKNQTSDSMQIVVVQGVGQVLPHFTTAVPRALILRLLSPALTFGNELPPPAAEGEPISPKSPQYGPRFQVNGSVLLPGSKSIANRVLLLAAIGQGDCTLTNLPACDDIAVMLTFLSKTLGREVESIVKEGTPSAASASAVAVKLRGAAFEANSDTSSQVAQNSNVDQNGQMNVWVENSGTTARFILPTLAFLLSRASRDGKLKTVRIDGNSHMQRRPIDALVDCIHSSFEGIKIEYLKSKGCLPLLITKTCETSSACGIVGGDIRIANKTSSQFVTAMLLAAPFANAPVTLHLEHLQATDGETGQGRAVSQPFIDMTLKVMKCFGVDVEVLSAGKYRIPNNGFTNPSDMAIEGDASAASYPLALAAISGGCVKVNMSRGPDALQGDTKFADLLSSMGCEVEDHADGVQVTGPPLGNLKPAKVDMSDMTDTFLTAASLMAHVARMHYHVRRQKGSLDDDNLNTNEEEEVICEISNIENQRVKECNRIAAVRENLCRFGVVVRETADGLQFFSSPVDVSESRSAQGVAVDCHNDHRVAMSAAIFSVVEPRVVIPDWRCVEKTFSDFWDVCERDLGMVIRGCAVPANLDDARPGRMARKAVPSCIALIGMRNSGKSFFGPLLAEQWGATFVDLDDAVAEHLEAMSPKNTDHDDDEQGDNQNRSQHVNGPAATTEASNGRSRSLSATEDEMKPVNSARVLKTIRAFIEEQGWPAFRELEHRVLKETLAAAEADTTPSRVPVVVACGGGTVEFEPSRALLSERRNQVVWIRGCEEQVIAYCEANDEKPLFGESPRSVYERRKIWYRELSCCEFVAPAKSSMIEAAARREVKYWKMLADNFCKAMGAGLLGLAPPVLEGSCFVSIPDEDPMGNKLEVARAASGCDAIELRVDMLKDMDTVGLQLFYVRSFTELPLILTLRSAAEGGHYVAKHDRKDYVEHLISLGRLCPAWLDVERTRLTEQQLQELNANIPPTVNLVMSSHQLNDEDLQSQEGDEDHPHHRRRRRPKVKEVEVESLLNFLSAEAPISPSRRIMPKLVFASRLVDNIFDIGAAVRRYRQTSSGSSEDQEEYEAPEPCIALVMGEDFRVTRSLNDHYSPVTAAHFRTPTAPGQITAHEYVEIRKALGLPVKVFFIFGSPVKHSPSPAFFNALFRSRGLPYVYRRYDTSDAHVIASMARYCQSFGGGSVTIPMKEKILKFGTPVDDSVKHIGAANCIYRDREGKIKIANTDAFALQKALALSKMTPSGEANSASHAMVIGTGGAARAACYAVMVSGLKLVVYGRDRSKAELLAKQFNGEVLPASRQLPAGRGLAAVISTVPGHVRMRLVQEFFASSAVPPVVIEMAYRPEVTNLVAKGRAFGCREVLGVTLLVWQAEQQADLFLTDAQTGNFSRSVMSVEEKQLSEESVVSFASKRRCC